VGHALDVAEAHGQQRLGALERLHLAFLVDAENQRLVGRIEVQPDHVAQFLDEERVGRQLEGVLAMRLQPEHLKEAMDAGLGDAGLRGQPAHTPVGGAVLGFLVQRRGQEPGDPLIVDRARLARAQFVVQTRDALLDEAAAPLADGRVGHAEPLRHGAVGDAIGTCQNQAGALHQPGRQRPRPGERRQLHPFVLAEAEFRLRTTHRHRGLPTAKDPSGSTTLMLFINGTEH
jgi:hypothetical protein